MIRLTRLNNQALTVNSDLIKFVEQSPDTLITLVTGEKNCGAREPRRSAGTADRIPALRIAGPLIRLDSSSSHTLLPDRLEGGKRETEKVTLDKASLAGIVLALGGILAGLILEGGNLGQILQPTAAMIVFGGTLGAVMLQFPLPIILLAVRQLGSVFVNSHRDPEATIQQLVQYAQKARREGIVSLVRSWRKSRILFSGNLSCWRLTGPNPKSCAR